MVEELAAPTLLHHYAHKANWDGFLERLHNHPEDALLQTHNEPFLKSGILDEFSEEDCLLYDVVGIAPIHLIVTRQDPPAQVLRALVDINVCATRLLTGDLRSALHYALFTKKSPEIIHILVAADPESISLQDCAQRNVFHIIAHPHWDNQKDVLSTILCNSCQTISETALMACDKWGHTPVIQACNVASRISKSDFMLLYEATPRSLVKATLDALGRAYKTLFQAALSVKPVPKTPVTFDDPTHFCNPERRVCIEKSWLWRPENSLSLWRGLHKAFVLLGAQDDSKSTYPVLHTCMEHDEDCLSLLFPCLLSLNPHYACQLKDKCLPIHLACRLARNTDGWWKRLDALLRIYPKGASIHDVNGHFPLEILHNRDQASWKFIYLVLQRHPVALARLGLAEQFYPTLLEKLHSCIDGTSTIFEILKETPTLIGKHYNDTR